jgi:hypothetical protein
VGEDRTLTLRVAEAVVEEPIEQFGLGARPHVNVTALADGMWQVRRQHIERSLGPLRQVAWSAWLEENVGSLNAGDLETTGS